jgi:sugar O-acyltransferase (sialic acid O-acetyltransferase NeuD family)
MTPAVDWVIVGAGAQGRITLDVLRATCAPIRAVFLDDNPELVGRQLGGVEIVGRPWLRAHPDPTRLRAIVAVGNNVQRLRVAGELQSLGIVFGNIVHPSAVLLPSATIGVGLMVAPQAVVGSGAQVGDHCIINTGAVVEHDCILGEGCSLSPGVRMAGRVTIGTGVFVGVGATLNPRITIGAGAIIGAGAVVTRDVGPNMVTYGNPAREVRPVDPVRDWRKLL